MRRAFHRCFSELLVSAQMWLIGLLLMLFVNLPASGEGGAPPSPDKAWLPPHLNEYESELANQNFQARSEIPQVTVDPTRVYNLPALIDIAERNNPKTRTAWERARQAADAVGLSQSAYFPFLAASAVAGYERAFLPFPKLQVGSGPADISIKGGGTLTTDVAAEGATLNLKWLLFDFGARKATTLEAKEKLMAANVSFNAVHQQIAFEVTRRFYEFDAARQKVTAAKSALRAAQTVAEAAEFRRTNGLATTPEVLEAEQQTALASFDLEAARGQLSDARVALEESLGILPTSRLRVAKVPEDSAVTNVDDSLDDLIDRALSQRPDLVAKLAEVRASRAEVQKARAAYYPKISLGANAGISELDVSANNSPYFGGNEPVYGAGIALELPLFDGFARSKKLRMARSELRAAESELADSRDVAVHEVWKAYTDFKTALHKQESATKLLSASQSAFDAALEAYRQGLGTYVDVANAQRNLAAAHSVMVDTRAAIFTSQAALALSIGDLAQPSPATASSQ